MPSELATDDIEALRALCVDLAEAAGRHAFDARRSLGPGARAAHDTKSSEVDPVTEFDRSTEALVVDRLRSERPDDAIVGEEGSNFSGTSGLEWHIDPIDGTVNFVYDLPCWCSSVAVVRDGEPIAGAINAPVVAETYSAGLGLGTTVNGVEIAVSQHNDLATGLVGTGFSYHQDLHRDAQAARIARVLPGVRDIRRSGSAALDLAYVASGRLDAYFEEFINSWDIAAGVLLVTEAGGVVSAHDGSRCVVTAPAGIAATNPHLQHPLLAAIDDATP